MNKPIMIDEKTIKAAESVLSKGYCVELRPVKDGIVKVIQVIRQQITEKPNKVPSP